MATTTQISTREPFIQAAGIGVTNEGLKLVVNSFFKPSLLKFKTK